MIDTAAKLDEWLPSLRAASWAAIDTEADSLHAYPEKLCLLQVSIDSGNVLIDPLAGLDLSLVLEEFKKHELILHGSDYDLRMLRKSVDFIPVRVFDTMLAARLLGIREFGLTNLVSRFLDIQLEKGPQKANWGRRPLTQRMEAYAVNDTAHLRKLSEILRQQLKEKGRLEWHSQMCDRLIAENSHVPPPDPDQVWRIKGSRHLPPRALAVLREVWRWREEEAVAANRPPYFILSPDALINIAAVAMDSSKAIEPMIPRHLTNRRRRGLMDAVHRGRGATPLPSIIRVRGTPPDEASKARFVELEARRNRSAKALEIDETLIASRATLAAISIHGERAVREMMPWQRKLIGFESVT